MELLSPTDGACLFRTVFTHQLQDNEQLLSEYAQSVAVVPCGFCSDMVYIGPS